VSLARYALVVLAVVGASLLAMAPFLAPNHRGAVLFGAGLAAANTLAAHYLLLWSASRSTRAFLWAVLGGMVGRMAALLAAVVIGILALGLPKVPLAISLLGYFVLFLVVELTLTQRRPARSEAR
jgi:hypothetical protein